MAKARKPRLGRGLNSLMAAPVPVKPPAEADAPPAPAEPADQSGAAEAPEETQGHAAAEPGPESEAGEGGLVWIAVDRIEPNPYQPRRAFDEAALGQLAESIRQDGVMQPIVVRPQRGQDRYQLVAGERRWRAAGRAGLDRIPAIVRELDDRKIAEWAVIENLQREDLNPIERAEAFARLIDQFQLSHQDVAERVGVNRSTITNMIRLLDLHEDVRELVRLGKLSSGHGRALLGLEDPQAQRVLAQRAMSDGWSVRTVEEAVRRADQTAGPESDADKKTPNSKPAHLSDLERQIGNQLQTKVKLKSGRKKNSGTLSIAFYDLDQFDALMERLGVDVE